MRQYELTYLISDNVGEGDLNKVTGKVGGYIKDAGGNLLKEEIWGRRKLAYPIKKLQFATYVTVNFDLPAEKAKEFEHNIKMTSKIVRHLLIVKDFGSEKLTLTSEDIAETEEIKEVIGGEKSFESIEGETEESKDLMSVRGSTTQILDTDLSRIVQKETSEEEKEKNEEIVEENASEVKETKEESKQAEEEAKKETKKSEKKTKKTTKKQSESSEADRLSKLDKELDDILGEDL